jgi:hypothetical protein
VSSSQVQNCAFDEKSRVFRSRCQSHHKRGSQRDVTGCDALRNRLHSRLRLAVPQATNWQRIGNQIDAAAILAGTDCIRVNIIFCETPPQAS